MPPRIPCLGPEALPESLRALDEGRIINLFKVLAHAPNAVEPIARVAAALLASGGLDPVDRELVILTCATRYESAYEWAQHIPLSRAAGVTDTQRAAVRDGDHDASVFSPAQRGLLAFAAAAADRPEVSDAVYAGASRHYDDEQLVETLILVGFYFLVARVSTVVGLEIDAPEGEDVLRMARLMSAG
ncbi:carboxymuconolactone decarboxylase family protein [Streptomyces sp. NPDC056987]|uniref:carboxymuconolactone decarboxylase family protein n=1 Tax=Streptomyces sp. NPDC056987 TaxID=3345988 RepID=UPI00362F3DA9